MKKIIFITCLGIIMAVASMAMAESKPIQLSLTPDIAVFDRDTEIRGLTLGIWGENPQTALAIGIVNGSKGNSAGLSFGFLLNYAESYKGLQWAPVNYTKKSFLDGKRESSTERKALIKGLQFTSCERCSSRCYNIVARLT